MPRFYFHLRNGFDTDDLEGVVLRDMNAARARAERYAIAMTAASVTERKKINLRDSINVANASGQIVIKVHFGDVVSVVA